MMTDVEIKIKIPKGVPLHGAVDAIISILESIGCHIESISADDGETSIREVRSEKKK